MTETDMPAQLRAYVRSMLTGPDSAPAHEIEAAIALAWKRGYRSTVGVRDAAAHYLDFGVTDGEKENR
jgi:hypothetical protein